RAGLAAVAEANKPPAAKESHARILDICFSRLAVTNIFAQRQSNCGSTSRDLLSPSLIPRDCGFLKTSSAKSGDQIIGHKSRVQHDTEQLFEDEIQHHGDAEAETQREKPALLR